MRANQTAVWAETEVKVREAQGRLIPAAGGATLAARQLRKAKKLAPASEYHCWGLLRDPQHTSPWGKCPSQILGGCADGPLLPLLERLSERQVNLSQPDCLCPCGNDTQDNLESENKSQGDGAVAVHQILMSEARRSLVQS